MSSMSSAQSGRREEKHVGKIDWPPADEQQPVHIASAVAVALLMWLAAEELLAAAGWALNLNTLGIAPFASGVLVLVIAASVTERRRLLQGCIIGAAIVLLSILLSVPTHDFSVDGQAYQQEAILQLARGWNPFYQSEALGKETFWTSHYPKGPWSLPAGVLIATGNVEVAKAVNLVYLAIGWLMVFGASRDMLAARPLVAATAATLVAVNPVSTMELTSFLVDGHVCALVTSAAMLLLYMGRRWSGPIIAGLFCVVVLGLNVKFTAFAYIVVLCIPVALVWMFKRQHRLVGRLVAVGIPALVAALLAGFNPYITNLRDHGHPLYPLAGKNSIDLMANGRAAQLPFLARNRVEKLLLSTFSESHNKMAAVMKSPSEQIQLKWPFVVHAQELAVFYKFTESRVGGFGPLFSGALVLSLCAALLAFATRAPVRNGGRAAIHTIMLGLVLSALLFPESWMVRYVPQLWTALVLLCTTIVIGHGAPEAAPRERSAASIWAVRGAWAAMLVLLVNAFFVIAAQAVHQVVIEADYRAQMGSLQRISERAMPLIEIQQESTRVRLQQARIRYREGPVGDCRYQDNLIGTDAAVCIPDEFAGLYLKGSPWVAGLFGRAAPTFETTSKTRD